MKPQVRVGALLVAAAVVTMAIAIGVIRHGSEDVESSPVASDSEAFAQAPVPAPESQPQAASPAATSLTPAEVGTRVRHARRLLEQGRAAAAESSLADVVAAAPAPAAAWNVLGRSRLALGDEAGARSAFERACDVDSTHAWARNNLGWMHLQNADWRAALPLLEAAARLDADVAVFHNNLAVAYERARRFEDAAREYARALELQPSHATAAAALARVQSRVASDSLAVAPAAADSITAPPLATRDDD
jgi:Flp pilus assembly protein TadD